MANKSNKNSNQSSQKIPVPLASLPAVLLPWYDREKRSLPWRDIVTPYRTWVSEIMLQQTRVQAVLPYFERFMAAAPDVPALAELAEDRLLSLWQGRLLQPRPQPAALRPRHGGPIRRLSP